MEATNVENRSFDMDLFKSLRDTLVSSINESDSGFNIDQMNIIKRNKDLSKGDFVIINQSKGKTGEAASQTLSSVVKQVLESSCEVDVIPQANPCECYIKLRRSHFFRKALKLVVANGEKYGNNQQGGSQIALLNCVVPPLGGLEALRCLLLAEHSGNLMQNSGYSTRTALPAVDRSALEDFNIQLCSPVERSTTLCAAEVQSKLLKSAYRQDEVGAGDSEQDVLLDLGQFIADRKVATGKDGYDKNMHLSKMGTALFPRLCALSDACGELDGLCVHVVSAAQEYTQQQVELTWQALTSFTQCKQSHQVVGGIAARKSGNATTLPTVEEFLKLRQDQMSEAAKLKYGEQVTGSGWMNTITALTVAGIKFEFLSTTCRSQLKLDLCAAGPVDTRGGVFVMYNYARLATLQDKFNQGVAEGIYPDIPAADQLDFSVLKDEEEWSLLFNYIMVYPSLLVETVADLSHGKLRGAIHSHKVCHFLSDLARDLSSYYRRVRILTEARVHLYPAMHCRLSLMRGLQTVMEHALHLLGIQPITQL